MRKTTIKDIAKKANVSIGTVSRALNSNGPVSPSTKEAVLKIAKELDYVPSTPEKGFFMKGRSIIGIIVTEISNPFLSEMVSRLLDVFRSEGYMVMLCNSNYDQGVVEDFVNELAQFNAVGLVIISTTIQDAALLDRINSSFKVVSIGDENPGMPTIEWHDRASTIKLIQHLIDFGHRKIACVGHHSTALQTMRRLEGYKECLQANGIPIREEYILGVVNNTSLNTGYVRTHELLKLEDPPTAIFFINDYYAMFGYKAVKEAGLQIGEDISFVGFDDYPLSTMISPSLTTVRVQIGHVIQFCKDILIRMIEDESYTPSASIVATEVILRESVKPNTKKYNNI